MPLGLRWTDIVLKSPLPFFFARGMHLTLAWCITAVSVTHYSLDQLGRQ